MDTYDAAGYELAERLTKRYSTSFSLSSKLFPRDTRKHIYAIYALVRIADEIVDTYRGADVRSQLSRLRTEVARSIETGYSVNPIVHAYAKTAKAYDIGDELIAPFFESMSMDLQRREFTALRYRRYIHGSAEVVGLMCLRVFVGGDARAYNSLESGARSLGAAYQKVNFLRDMKADHAELGRTYFPDITFEAFDDSDKRRITDEIEQDFANAATAMRRLPENSKPAVRASYYYYYALFKKLQHAPAQTIVSRRLRVANWYKIFLLLRAAVGA